MKEAFAGGLEFGLIDLHFKYKLQVILISRQHYHITLTMS